MTFIIKNPYPIEVLDAFKASILSKARKKIRLYKTGANEIGLNKYFYKNYGCSLKTMCIHILFNCKFMVNGDNEVIVKMPDRRIDNLATFITFVNGRLQCSNILKYAFSETKGANYYGL